METPTICKTNDYSIFKSVDFNRDKRKRHIGQLKKVILNDNNLHLHPILVNEEMEVIDGQHRLEVARELNLDIFYIKDNISYNHILSSNLNQRNLSLKDVVKFYAVKDGKEDYIALMFYLDELELNPKALLGLLFGTSSTPMLQFIKSGRFQMPTDTLTVDFLIGQYQLLKTFAQEKRITPLSMFKSSFFTIAYRNLVTIKGYSEDIWFSKLHQKWFDLRPQVNAKDWTRLLINTYNWKNQQPLHDGTS